MLFTWWMHDNRPLSRWLEENVLSAAMGELQNLQSVEEVDAFLADLEATLVRVRPPDLAIVRYDPDHLTRGGSWRPGRNPGESIGTQRWLFRVEVVGDLDMLVTWPDKVKVDVDPTGHRLADEPTPDDVRLMTTPRPSPQDQSPVFAELTRYSFLYTPAYIRSSGRESAVYFTFDVTGEELGAYARTNAFANAAAKRMAYLRELCRAINAQVEAYVRGDLATLVSEFALLRRQGLDDRAAIRASLSFGSDWAPDPPRLADVPGRTARHDSATASSPDDGVVDNLDGLAEIGGAPTSPRVTELIAPGGQRLSSATFNDVQRVIGTWASGVQAYPRSFAKLTEDDLSCLVASTLNATLPGADREVYRYNGKTDVLVRAEALPGGVSSEPVFVCEAKKLSPRGGPSVAKRALENQLLTRYTTAYDTAAVLLLFMTHADLYRPRERILKAVKEVQGYRAAPPEVEGGVVDDWPILTYERGERRIRVCIATVHLPVSAI